MQLRRAIRNWNQILQFPVEVAQPFHHRGSRHRPRSLEPRVEAQALAGISIPSIIPDSQLPISKRETCTCDSPLGGGGEGRGRTKPTQAPCGKYCAAQEPNSETEPWSLPTTYGHALLTQKTKTKILQNKTKKTKPPFSLLGKKHKPSTSDMKVLAYVARGTSDNSCWCPQLQCTLTVQALGQVEI